MKRILRHGYTTGACAAAAAKGAAIMLGRQELVNEATIDLPAGYPVTFQLHGCSFNSERASCFIVKDAGDDPDITNGAEIHAEVMATPSISFFKAGTISISAITVTGGTGIGKITKPGLAVPPGEFAINPVPRRMIEEALRQVFPLVSDSSSLAACDGSLQVTISIPDGEVRAKKTLNSRLGIIGGLSILGTTGIVRPISAKAWTDTIDAALDVAKASGCSTVILSTGRTSELAAQKRLSAPSGSTQSTSAPEEAYIMMGDHVAYALRAAVQRNFMRPVIACQFAKLLKIACGHENTHAAASELDLTKLLEWARSAGLSSEITTVIANANTAREVVTTCNFAEDLVDLVKRYALQAAKQHAPKVDPIFLVADYKGELQEDF
ncbi:MAG: cobalt-precorrin-6A synthase [Geobacteraceae bacterium GWC2_48_7]|nr:MAG: cobalt-precorrin-6A synthase [Geobacteraceae bacterium GWC2_48_7]